MYSWLHHLQKTCCETQATDPLIGQLPMERVTPDVVFNWIGVDYAGPIYVKYSYVCKPTVVKTYVCVFVSLTVTAVHLELVSDLSTDVFIACPRCFISRRGISSLIWSDHGTNSVGTARELKELSEFLKLQKTQKEIASYLNFATQSTYAGSSFLSISLVWGEFGRLQSRASNLT